MLEDYSKFDKATLVEMALSSDNWDAPNALYEMYKREYPEVPDLALRIADWALLHDEHTTAQALSMLFATDQARAIQYSAANYKSMHLYSLARVLSELAGDLQVSKSPEEMELIKKVREHLNAFSAAELGTIKDDYDAFMEAYGSLK